MVLHFKDFVQNPNQIMITDNQMQDVKTGITILWESGVAGARTPLLNATIQHNVVKEAERALVLDGVAGVTVVNNDFPATRRVVQLGGSLGAFDVRITDNQFTGLGRNSGHGIILSGPVAAIDFQGNAFTDLGSTQIGGSAIYYSRGATTNIGFTTNTFSSPNRFTQTAIGAAATVSFNAATNTWKDNVLADGIQPGTFPH